MSETQASRSPLVSLVLFICCLAIAAGTIAAVHYFVIDLPAQKNVQAPENAVSSQSNCALCMHNCKIDPDYHGCLEICKNLECSGV